jgi:indolepyruvate decarboxylase
MCRSNRTALSRSSASPAPPSSAPSSSASTTLNAEDAESISIGDYLIHRLIQYGVHHIFGIPGDYVLGFFNKLEAHRDEIDVIGCCREDCAGFAADGYARVNGMGAICVTYCVGGFSTLNSIAGAAAENSAVVVITGSPGMSERSSANRNGTRTSSTHSRSLSLHHQVGDLETQAKVFAQVCATTTILNDPPIAAREIDRVLDTCFREKKPVYIEIPRDMVAARCSISTDMLYTPIPVPTSDVGALQEACADACTMITHSRKPIIVAGVDLSRYGLEEQLLAFAEASSIPIITLMMGKGIIEETHPLFAGVYHGEWGSQATAKFVEESDCIIMLGLVLSDLDQCIYGNMGTEQSIVVAKGQVVIRHRQYHNVVLGDFLHTLTSMKPVVVHQERQLSSSNISLATPIPSMILVPATPITIGRAMMRLNELLTKDHVIVADVGDSMFAATELILRAPSSFFSSAFYASMGFAVPASIGIQMAKPDCRPIVIVGDGAFQMTGLELSTAVKNEQNPIVLVLDNAGYGTERLLHPGESHKYNSIQPWKYHLLPTLFGGGTGSIVETEGEYDDALSQALADSSQMHLIQVKLAEDDASHVLRRMAKTLSNRVCN